MQFIIFVVLTLSLTDIVNAVCTRFPVKVEKKAADGTLETYCEYKAPNSATGVKILSGLKIKSQRCITCECTSMGLICCKEDKPDRSTVPEGCMVTSDRCGYKMVLIHDRNVECMPLNLLGDSPSPATQHAMKTGTYGSGKQSLQTHGPQHGAANYETVLGKQIDMIAANMPQMPHGRHTNQGNRPLTKSTFKVVQNKPSQTPLTTVVQQIPAVPSQTQSNRVIPNNPTKASTANVPILSSKTTLAQPDPSLFDLMTMQSFMDGGGVNQLGGIEGIATMNALSAMNSPTSGKASSGSSNMLNDLFVMQALREGGGLGGMSGIGGMAALASLGGMGSSGLMFG